MGYLVQMIYHLSPNQPFNFMVGRQFKMKVNVVQLFRSNEGITYVHSTLIFSLFLALNGCNLRILAEKGYSPS